MRPDILLVDIRTPRLRSLSDNVIENGLYIVKENLRSKGLEALVEDPGILKYYESLSPKFLTKMINHLSGRFLDTAEDGKNPSVIYTVPALVLQIVLNRVQNKRMEKYLSFLVDKIVERDIPIVGKKVWYGRSYKWAKVFTDMLHKRVPEVIVVDGGPHPSVYQEDYVRETNADIVIFSEGEIALSKIVSIAKDLRSKGLTKKEILIEIKRANISNVAYREGEKIIKNTIKNTPLNIKTVQRHDESLNGRLKVAVINDALGCPYNSCNFCDYRNIYSEYMSKNPRLVVDEMKYFVKKGVGLFRFTSGSNSLDDSVAIAEEILRNGLKVNYSFFNRCEPKARENCEEVVGKYVVLINSGLRATFLGAESGNDLVLRKVMNKGITGEDVIYTVKAIREASRRVGQHIDISLSIIYPHPILDGISLERAYEDTLSLIRETMPDSVLPLPPGPFSGSQWFSDEKFGFDYYNPKKPETAYLSRAEKQSNIAKEMMAMEYILYLPPKMWTLPNILLNGMNARAIFEMNGKIRKNIRALGIENDLADDHFLLLRAAGYQGRDGAAEFKTKSMQAILSCDYDFVRKFYNKVNQRSEELARQSLSRQIW